MSRNRSKRGSRSVQKTFCSENGGRFDSGFWQDYGPTDDMRSLQFIHDMSSKSSEQTTNNNNQLPFQITCQYSVAQISRSQPTTYDVYNDPTNAWRTWVAQDLKNGLNMQQSAKRWQEQKNKSHPDSSNDVY